MDRAAWWVMDHGLAELDMPEQHTHTHMEFGEQGNQSISRVRPHILAWQDFYMVRI